MAPTADAVVGMMDAAYFVGRKELLDFLNDTLDLKLQKIEQTASGAVACQLFDIMYPNSIQMSKVNWGAKSDYEFVQNYKILQGGFNKHHVQRHVDVDKLIRAKYQDNLEFMQWFKAFFDHSGGSANLLDYNPHEVRNRGKGGDKYNAQFGAGGGNSGISTARSRSGVGGLSVSRSTGGGMASTKPRIVSANASEPIVKPKPVANPTSPRQHRPLRERPQQQPINSSSTAATDDKETNREQLQALTSKNAELESQVQELQLKVEDLEVAVLDIEKERDFYFEKLRNVEVLLQVYQENHAASGEDGEDVSPGSMPAELVDKIFKVLYATPEEEVIVTNEGELIPAEEILSQELSSTVV